MNLSRYFFGIAFCAIFLAGLSCKSGADNSELYKAIGQGDARRVRSLLDSGANPDSNLVKPGFWERPTRPGSKNPPSPLIFAILENQTECATALLEKGAKVAYVDEIGFSPLEHAISNSNPAIVKALLDRGADAKADSKFGFPLVFAAASDSNQEIIKQMLAKGADANAHDVEGKAVGHYIGSLESVFERLEGRSANRTQPGATPLMLAAQEGHTEVIKALLESGADVNAKDSAGRNALMIVAEEGVSSTRDDKYLAVARALLDKGIDVTAKDNNGATALRRAQRLAGLSPLHDELMRMLQAAGVTE